MLPLGAAAAAEGWATAPLLVAHVGSWLRTGLFVLVLLSVICLAGLVGRRRLVGFVALHVASYAANLTLILMVACDNRPHTLHYLWALVPAHLLNGAFSFYTIRSSGSGRGRECQRGGLPLLRLFLVDFLVMGLLQGAQVKLAVGECRRLRRRAADRRLARFHCKAVDGILEGTTFGFVASYMLLKQHIDFHGSLDIGGTEVTWWRDWQNAVLQAVKWLSLLNVGLATMEVDHWTSSYVRQQFAGSIGQVRHLSFRAMEFALRLCTLILLCICVRLNRSLLWPAVVLVVVDYLVGVALLAQGDRRLAALILGLALWMVNILQFSDGRLRRPAKRITCIVVPWRTFQCLAVLGFLIYSHELTDLWKKAFLWLLCLAVSAALYYFLLLTYAMRGFRREEDLLGAVEHGNLEVLRLLPPEARQEEVNHCSPDGFNALHLAAKLGRVDFLAELCDAGAELGKSVDNRTRSTAFHLAAMRDDTEALSLLCDRGARLAELLALDNSRGDTAFHVAAMKEDTSCLSCLCEVARRRGLQALLEIGNGEGATALHEAARRGSAAAARALCEVNREPGFLNARDGAGETALHLAARAQSADLVEALLAMRVDHTLPNRQNQTAYDVAWSDGWAFEGRVVELLRGPEEAQKRGAAGGAEAEAAPAVELRPLVPPVAEGRHRMARAAGAEAGGQEQHRPAAVQELQQPPVHRQEGPRVAAPPERRLAVEPEAGVQAPKAPERPPLTSIVLSAGISPMGQTFLRTIQEDDAEAMELGARHKGQTAEWLQEFQVLKGLGTGSFGEVSLVQRRGSEERFAMKRLEKLRYQRRGLSQKVQRELDLLKRITVLKTHRFVVRLHCSFETQDHWYLVMDYCCNRDLEVVLRERGAPGLDLADVARLTGEVLLGLEFVHGEHVMMRDLKPENVVLDAEYRARITDFGLAKHDDGVGRNTDCGTPGYVAPEVRTDRKYDGFKADVYAFGVVVYVLLSGGQAFCRDGRVERRIAPPNHRALERGLEDAEGAAEEVAAAAHRWARPQEGATQLIRAATALTASDRPSCGQLKDHDFFRSHLGRSWDELLDSEEAFPPPGPPRG